jgi:hypothetical protein
LRCSSSITTLKTYLSLIIGHLPFSILLLLEITKLRIDQEGLEKWKMINDQ